MFHHMRLREWNAATGQEIHDIDVKVVSDIQRINEPLRRPDSVTVGHGDRLDLGVVFDQRLRRVHPR